MSKTLYANVKDGLWIGDKNAAADYDFLQTHNITAVISLSGTPKMFDDIDYFDYTITSQELLSNEVSKTISKLDTIFKDIKTLRDNNRIVLINCIDSKNKSPLVAGYYLMKTKKDDESSGSIIWRLESIYFTAVQFTDEAAYRYMVSQNMVNSSDILPEDIQQKLRDRNEIRCLTNRSFRNILRVE